MGEEVEMMWTEKYRPRWLGDIVDQREVVGRLKQFVKDKNIPHMLFAGPAGVGKTAAALALSHELYGETWRANTLELNASDERGITMVRERVKDYARIMALGGVPFKLVILDEGDAMTSDAQTALRRVMEMYARTCRFILICNYSSRIIEPIQSRCAIFRFSPLRRGDVAERLRYIAGREGVKLVDGGVEAVWYVCGGDLRRAINTLQAASALGTVVDDQAVFRVVGKASPAEINEMLALALEGNFLKARAKMYDLMAVYGLSGSDIIRQIHREIFNLPLPEEGKVRLAELAGEVDFRLVEGANEDIQLSALLAQFTLQGSRLRSS